MTCGSCKYWGSEFDANNEYRQCRRLRTDEGVAAWTDAEAAENARDWDEPLSPLRQEIALLAVCCGSLRTRAAFGCVLHESNTSNLQSGDNDEG